MPGIFYLRCERSKSSDDRRRGGRKEKQEEYYKKQDQKHKERKLRVFSVLLSGVRLRLGRCDLDEAGIERRAAADVGEALRGEHVDVLPAGRQFCPVQSRGDHAALHASI